LNLSVLYELPAHLNGRAAQSLLGGWEVGGILNARTGLPVGITISRPDVVPGVDPFIHTSDRRYFLNPGAFTIPKPGTFGNLGRYALHGPGLSQLDFTLHKKFAIDENKRNIEFRAELYNILNHANFANPPAVLTGGLSTSFQPGSRIPALKPVPLSVCSTRP
jgi:hypothetical protein